MQVKRRLAYHVEMEKTQKNIPSFGRAKEIAPESVFECFIISHHPLQIGRAHV